MKNKGYTIAELLATIGILLIFVFIIVPLLMNSPSRREKQAAMKEGAPIIEAVNRYKNDKGQWPKQTEDFVPSYLKAMPNNLWHYSEGQLIRRFNGTREYIVYNFEKREWKAGKIG